MYVCVCLRRKEKKERERYGDFDSTRKSMASSLVFLCPIMSVDVGREAGDGMRLEILAGPCAKGKRPREVHPLSSLFQTASGGASIIYLSQSGIGRSLAGKLRENIRTTVDKLLTSSFCAGRDEYL